MGETFIEGDRLFISVGVEMILGVARPLVTPRSLILSDLVKTFLRRFTQNARFSSILWEFSLN